MIEINLIREREEKTIQNFLSIENFKVPSLPNYLNKEIVKYWEQLNFNIHYLPKIALKQNMDFPQWKNKLPKVLYKKIEDGKIDSKAINLSGQWILIDSRDKPEKKTSWITSENVRILKKFGINIEKHLKQKSAQIHKDEYLSPILKKQGFKSRFCLSINDINKLKPFILNLLKLNNKIVRLPYFIEYNYLGNAIYKQWATTKTWEWFEDIYDHNQHLAGGYNSVSAIGWDPIDYWSTILTFRPIIIL